MLYTLKCYYTGVIDPYQTIEDLTYGEVLDLLEEYDDDYDRYYIASQ